MMNLKKHLFATLLGAALTLTIGGSLSWLLRSRAHLIEEKRKFRRVENQFEHLRTRTPYPSEDNVEITKQNLTQLKDFEIELERILCASQIEPEEMERAEFPERLEVMYRDLGRIAASQNVLLPDSFFFGFDAYQGVLPAARDVSRLTVQVGAIEAVCKLLFFSGITSIEAIERIRFERSPHENRSRRAPRSGRGRSRRSANTMSRVVPSSGRAEDRKGTYAVEHVDLLFTARDEQIWAVLDSFSSSQPFAVVTSVEFKSATPGLVGTRPAFSDVSSGPTPGFISEKRVPKILMTRDERIVAGRDEKVEVRIGVDLYRFCFGDEEFEKRPGKG